jgi:preprotein translocase subunit SecE
MASVQVETVSSGADKVKLAAAVLLLIAAIASFYWLSGRGDTWVQWSGLIVGLILAAAAFLTSEPGRRLIAMGRDSWRETEKVVWPSRKEAIRTTAFVFAFTVAMALVLWISDKVLGWVLYDLLLGWGR